MMNFKRIKSSNNHSTHRFILNRRSVVCIYERFLNATNMNWEKVILVILTSNFEFQFVIDTETMRWRFWCYTGTNLLVTQSHRPQCDLYQCESHRRNVKLKHSFYSSCS